MVADFQAILVALTLLERLPSGRYPERNPAHAAWLLPLTEYTRQSVISGAQARDIDLLVTNSDGSPERRNYLLSRMGPGSQEVVLDPEKPSYGNVWLLMVF